MSAFCDPRRRRRASTRRSRTAALPRLEMASTHTSAPASLATLASERTSATTPVDVSDWSKTADAPPSSWSREARSSGKGSLPTRSAGAARRSRTRSRCRPSAPRSSPRRRRRCDRRASRCSRSRLRGFRFRAREEEHFGLGAEDLRQPLQAALVHRLEVRPAVVDDRLRHGRKHFGRDRSRARGEQITLLGQALLRLAQQAGPVRRCLAFGAALLALRLGGALAGKWRARRRPELAAWSAALVATRSRRVLWPGAPRAAGASLRFASTTCSAGCSRQRCSVWGPRSSTAGAGRSTPASSTSAWRSGSPSPRRSTATSPGRASQAQEHLGFLPARLVAILGNSVGTIAVIGVAIATIRRRPLGNVLIITGVAVAA